MTRVTVNDKIAKAFRKELEDVKKSVFLKVFRHTGGNTSKVAQILDHSRGTTTQYFIKWYGKNYKQTILNQ